MAIIPTLLALAVGVGLGLRWGGRIDHLLDWRPDQPALLAAWLTAVALTDLAGVGGGFGALLTILGMAALLGFAVLNVRTGGMVLVAAGVALDLIVAVLNGGTPVSSSALVSSGLVERGDLGAVQLSGGRTIGDGALLGFLGDTIPLPWGQVVSIGDVLMLAGITLVTASVVRRYQVGGAGHGRMRAASRNTLAPNDYRTALDALGRGPAPRRGPGLHPSRLDERRGRSRGTARRRPGSGAR